MAHVVYNKETTLLVQSKQGRNTFKSEAAAKAALTRHCYYTGEDKSVYAIADYINFHENIEKMVEKVNMMSGAKYMERANTPSYCSPSSEAYWSM